MTYKEYKSIMFTEYQENGKSIGKVTYEFYIKV